MSLTSTFSINVELQTHTCSSTKSFSSVCSCTKLPLNESSFIHIHLYNTLITSWIFQRDMPLDHRIIKKTFDAIGPLFELTFIPLMDHENDPNTLDQKQHMNGKTPYIHSKS